MTADGSPDVLERLEASGESVIPQLVGAFGRERKAPMPLPEFYEWTTRLSDYRQRYLDYWLSTAHTETEGRVAHLYGRSELRSSIQEKE